MTTYPTVATAVSDPLRERAGNIVTDLAERLADPEEVSRVAHSAGNRDVYPGGHAAALPWTGLNLGEGHAGLAVVYGALSHTAPELRTTAHAYLTAAARDLPAGRGEALYGGATPLAFAALVARRTPEDYAGLVDRLDERVTAYLRSRLAQERERLDAGRAGVSVSVFDVIGGVSGLGRYLMERAPHHQDLLAETLSYLVRLTRPTEANGHSVPGWWDAQPPGLYDHPRFAHGHFNLGLSHGITGALALLALGWEAGVRVPGHAEAIADIVEHLVAWRLEGGLWPSSLGFEEFLAGPDAPRDPKETILAWCYGTPGVVRALYLAGRALDRPDWRETAVRSLDEALDFRHARITDCSLCHGWAGLLHVTWRMVRDSGDARLARRLTELAQPLVAAYDPELPFGFYYERPVTRPGVRLAPHRAGFLEGAGGAVLALHTYATDSEPPGNWDAALLLN